MGGTHGNVTVYGIYGAGILVMYIITSPWIGGGVVAMLICRTTMTLASRYIGCGEQENMGGSLDSTSPYDGWYDGDYLWWTLPSGSMAIWWDGMMDITEWFYSYMVGIDQADGS